MRRLLSAFAVCSLVVTSGCSAVRNELRYPGGHVGRLLDKRTFDAAHSKHIQLFRAAMVIAIAARIGESTVEPEDGDIFALQLADAATELNYAAADAGFQIANSEGQTCAVFDGFEDRTELPEGGFIYETDDAENCTGYFVNFESHLARIEGRVIRAMLTALPTEKAREFLEDISKGDLLSSLWSLMQSVADLGLAFHRGAGVYRAGTETMAASMEACVGDASYDFDEDTFSESKQTVLFAAACLGLSRIELFDRETAEAGDLPTFFSPKAFHAMFRIARAACVEIPIANGGGVSDEQVIESRRYRKEHCGRVAFNPQVRPLEVSVQDRSEDTQAVTDPAPIPADQSETELAPLRVPPTRGPGE